MADCIQDQRHIYGGRTVAAVQSKWLEALDALNRQRRERMLDEIYMADTGVAVPAYINHGRWVAECVCGGGMGAWRENPVAACMDCGRIYGVEWPSDDDQIEAERLLLERPRPENRNWVPWQETVEHLSVENGQQ